MGKLGRQRNYTAIAGQPCEELRDEPTLGGATCRNTISQHRGISFDAPRRALENGSMAADFRVDPGLRNLRRTTIERLTELLGMRA
jgi:hypothetical protein